MPRRAKGLTAAFVGKAAKPGRYADGGGLYLEVRSKNAKFWESHFTLRGKRRSMGGGSASGPNAIKLAEARVWNPQVQAIVREGRDRIAERQAAKAARAGEDAEAKAKAVTFAEAAGMYIRAHQAAWRDPRHAQQWRSSLDRHVLHKHRETPIALFDTGVVMQIIEPLWSEKTETASRVRGRIGDARLPYISKAALERARWMTLAGAVDRICQCDCCDRRSALKQLRNALGDRVLDIKRKEYKRPPIEYDGLSAGYRPPGDARFWQQARIRGARVFDQICESWRTLLILKDDVFRLWPEPPDLPSASAKSRQAITKAKGGRPTAKEDISRALDKLSPEKGLRVKDMPLKELAARVARRCGKQLGRSRGWSLRTVLQHIRSWLEEH